MRKVVCNTTPLLSLLKIGHLHLLERLYIAIIVPEGVWLEIEAGRKGHFYTDLSALPWVKIRAVQHAASVNYLTDLDRGEAEVLVLAREIEADLVIIDERLGRKYAAHFNLPLTGTLGILLRAKQAGHISRVKPLLQLLREQGVWLSDRVFKEVVRLAGE